MALPPDVMKELIATFRIDVDDQLQTISDVLLSLENVDQDERQDLLHSAMRAAHNLKGAARGIGVGDVGEISHSFENLLTRLKKNTTAFTPEVGDLCFETVDSIKLALKSFIEEIELPFDKPGLIRRLNDERDGDAAAPASVPDPGPEPGSEPESKPEPKQKQKEKKEPGAEDSTATKKAAGGEVLRVTVDKLDQLESLIEGIHASKMDLDDFIENLSTIQNTVHTLAADDETERLADVASELSDLYKSMQTRGRYLGVALNSIRYEMRTLRMVPVAGLTRPLARSVRDIARELDKKVTFKTVGEDTEMDRAVMELLTDPLSHLLRNAIDHGIESPAARLKAGKPETGSIEISFQIESGMVLIALSDDGNGIYADKILETAINRNVISRDEAENISHSDILDLIFHPGFSTKEIITDVSGRGVGMDIVRTNIQALNGDITMTTREGEGSTFTLSVPLTLATERGLVIGVDDQIFAIPLGNVDRVMDGDINDLVDIEGGKAMMVDGHPVPLRRMSGVLKLGVDKELPAGRFMVVVVAAGWRRVAFVIDNFIGQRELVIRSLSAPLINVQTIAGGTLIGGRVRLVLDPEGLINVALKSGQRLVQDGGNAELAKTILAVDDSLTTRTLLKNVLESAGYDVTTAVNGEEAWGILRDTDFDLVVSDIEMPVMNGFDLTRIIKDSDQHDDVPVIIVTSLTSEEDKQKGVEVGADAYIVKSDFETRVLLDVIEQLI